MKTIARLVSGIVAAGVLFTLMSCNEEKVLESSKIDKTVVMTIDSFDVPLELYRYVALNYKDSYESGQSQDIWLGDSGAALIGELDEDVEGALIRLYSTLSLCDDYGIKLDDSYIIDSLDMQMTAVYTEFENDYEVYADTIAQHHMNDSVYRFIMRNEILAEELLNKMIAQGEIPTDSEVLRGIIEGDEFIRVKQILVAVDNGKTDEENLARANELLEMVENGEDFDTLVQTYGEDLYMFNNDDGYYFAKGRLHENFEEAAFQLEIGEVSGVIKTNAGYSIIKRYEKEADYIDNNFEDLCDDYISGLYNIALEKYSAGLTAEPTEELNNYSIFTLAETENKK